MNIGLIWRSFLKSKVTECLDYYQSEYQDLVQSLNLKFINRIIQEFIIPIQSNEYIWQCNIVLKSPPIIRVNDEFDLCNIPYSDELLIPQVYARFLHGELSHYLIWNLYYASLENIVWKVTTASSTHIEYEYPKTRTRKSDSIYISSI